MNDSERNNAIFDFAYSMAMLDATQRTNAAESKDDYLDFDNRNSKKAKSIVNKFVNETLDGKQIDFYGIAKDVVDEFHQIDDKFTFGNAQKLINMSAKYLYIMSYNTKGNRVSSKFEHFHCPMDRIMIEKVTRAYKAFLDSNSIDKKQDETINFLVIENGIVKRTMDWNKVAWSNLSFDDNDIQIYKKYQNMVSFFAGRKQLSPIEFDLKYWSNPII